MKSSHLGIKTGVQSPPCLALAVHPPGRVIWLAGRWAVVLLSCLLARLLAKKQQYNKSINTDNSNDNNNINNNNNNNGNNNTASKSWMYCWSHGWNKSHNGTGCTRQCVGHQPYATTHAGTGGNPKNHFEMTQQSQQQQWQQNNNNAGGQQRMPTWQQQANAAVTFQPQQVPMPTQQPQQQMQWQPPQQQQWANFGGVCAPINQMGMYRGAVAPPIQGNNMGMHY